MVSFIRRGKGPLGASEPPFDFFAATLEHGR
jgi:hypothetical protein